MYMQKNTLKRKSIWIWPNSPAFLWMDHLLNVSLKNFCFSFEFNENWWSSSYLCVLKLHQVSLNWNEIQKSFLMIHLKGGPSIKGRWIGPKCTTGCLRMDCGYYNLLFLGFQFLDKMFFFTDGTRLVTEIFIEPFIILGYFPTLSTKAENMFFSPTLTILVQQLILPFWKKLLPNPRNLLWKLLIKPELMLKVRSMP